MLPSAIPLLDLALVQGKTFSQVIRWEVEPLVSKPIASITQAAPAVVVTQAAHGLVDGWRVAVVSAKGMRDVSALAYPPESDDFHRATILDSTSVELNEVNTADYAAHTANSGFLVWWTPASLADCTARMTIRDKPLGTELLSLTTENSRILLDDTTKTVTLLLSAAETAALTWTRGVYDLEIEDGDGVVTGLYQGTITVELEETT